MEKTKKIQVVKYQALLKSQQPKEFLDIFICVHNCTSLIFTSYHSASSPIPLPLPFPKVLFLLLCKQIHIYIYVPNMRTYNICLSFSLPHILSHSSFIPSLRPLPSSTSLLVSIFIPHLCIKSEFCTRE